jgi:hypothetical protein
MPSEEDEIRAGISPPLNREYWMKALQEAERELDAATTRIDVNAAAKRFMRAKVELEAA